MNKKTKLIVMFTILIISLIILSTCTNKTIKQNLIKNNIKSLNKQDVTTIDITEIKTGKEIEHEHILKSQYDNTQHWNYCIICGEIQDRINHTYKTTWALGTESCNWNNSYTKTCTCGYSETGHRPCVWDGKTYTRVNWFHYKPCSICNSAIEHAYYLGSYGKGDIYIENSREKCRKSNGEIINCNNLGTCSKCKTQFTNRRHLLNMQFSTGKIICAECNEEFGTFTSDITQDSNVPATYTFVTNCVLTNGATFESIGEMRKGTGDSGTWETNKQTVTNLNSSKTRFTLTTTAKFKSTIKVPYETYTSSYVSINGLQCGLTTEWDQLKVKGYTVYPDLIKPEISSITSESSLVEWSKTKPIIIEGTENWCNTVKVKILDEKENIIFSGESTVNNGKYSISCTPELEAGIEGRTFKAIVTDMCENSTQQEFTIAKIDSIAPEIISGNKISENWSKEKNFTFIATDYGIGNVQIAFNEIKDYKLTTKNGTEYSREYKFVGDSYNGTKAMVFYKDELGNTTSQEITIDKLDNTAPTITDAEIHNNKLNVQSHDRHATLGEGSGVTKYRYITSKAKLENTEITTENSTEVNSNEKIIIPDIYKVKYIYIVAEDLVGNVSEAYEVKVPQLELTSKVNLNEANGKGTIELNWSEYDISDKYFVIYRKQEGEEEWKTIVGLDKKINNNKYIDNLGNDKNSPTEPNINIQGNKTNNTLEITSNSTDTGTKYTYYIESYDSTDMSLLNTSNEEKI